MFCLNCGREMPDNMRFCENCGAAMVPPSQMPVETQPQDPIPPTKKEKKSKRNKVVLILVLVAVILVAAAAAYLYLSWYNSPEQEMMRALEEDNLDEAVEIYLDKMDGDASDELIDALTKKINTLKDDYLNETETYTATIQQLDSIRELEIDDLESLLDETETYVDKLNDSRTAFNTAETLRQKGEYDEAMQQYKKVWDEDPNYDTALSLLNECVDSYRNEILATAKTYSDNELYEDAIRILEVGLTVLPNDSIITEQISLCEVANTALEKQNLLDKAENYAKNGDYLAALELLENYTSDADVKAAYLKYADAYTNSLLDEAASMVSSGDYPGAIELLKPHTDDKDIETAYNKYCKEYETEILAQADTLMAQKDYDGAITLLKQAQKVLPNNSNLSDKISEAESKKPVSLKTIKIINKSNVWGDWNDGTPIDPFDNNYSYSHNYIIQCYHNSRPYYDQVEHYAEWRVYENYTSITGTLAPYTSMPENGTSYIQIFGDDQLLYTSPTIGRKTDAFDFEVNITGVDYIKIYVYTPENNCSIILSNLQLWA